jgi:hypothetical protein
MVGIRFDAVIRASRVWPYESNFELIPGMTFSGPVQT